MIFAAPSAALTAMPASLPIPNTHPGRIAAVAALLGRGCAPAEKCCVLEIGCGSGLNLLSMAQQLPDSAFLGIEASSQRVEAGRVLAGKAGIGNARFEAMPIAGAGAALGQFDYVVCHGVFSRLAPDLQKQLLQTIKARLAPEGIALVSYDVLPGWALPLELRRMLAYRSRRFNGPVGKLRAVRELITVLAQSLGGREDGWSRSMEPLLKQVASLSDEQLVRDFLQEGSAPCHFHEFASRAAEAGLAYFAEADFHTHMGLALPAAQRARIGRLAADPIEFEQYADFVAERAFRSSLLVHAAAGRRESVGPARIGNLYLRAEVRPETDAEGGIVFANGAGLKLKPKTEAVQAALAVLAAAAPRSLGFDEIRLETGRRIGREVDPPRLASDLQAALECGALTAATRPVAAPVSLPERPLGSALARALAATQDALPTLDHRAVRLEPLARLTLLYLNGTRDRAELIRLLGADLPRRRLHLQLDGKPVAGDELARRLPAALDETLCTLHGVALIAA